MLHSKCYLNYQTKVLCGDYLYCEDYKLSMGKSISIIEYKISTDKVEFMSNPIETKVQIKFGIHQDLLS